MEYLPAVLILLFIYGWATRRIFNVLGFRKHIFFANMIYLAKLLNALVIKIKKLALSTIRVLKNYYPIIITKIKIFIKEAAKEPVNDDSSKKQRR